MPDETITLTQHYLGMEPYVLLVGYLDGGELAFKVEGGGPGIDSREHARLAIILALSGMGPLSDDEREQLGVER